MEAKDLPDTINRLETKYIDKMGKKPSGPWTITVTGSGFYWSHFEGEMVPHNHVYRTKEDIDDLIASINGYIDELPDPAIAGRLEFQRKLAALIEEGNSLGLEKKTTDGLYEAASALSSNLLTYQGVKE